MSCKGDVRGQPLTTEQPAAAITATTKVPSTSATPPATPTSPRVGWPKAAPTSFELGPAATAFAKAEEASRWAAAADAPADAALGADFLKMFGDGSVAGSRAAD